MNARLSQTELNAQALEVDTLADGIGGRAARASVASIAGQVARLAIQLGSMIALARLLTPVDFGLVAMASTVTVLVANVSDFGLGAATIQRKEIVQAAVSGLFYLNAIIGLLASVAIAAVAPVASSIFGDPRVTIILVALSGVLFVQSLGVQHLALLARRMRFGTSQAVTLIAQTLAAIAAIAAAYFFNFGFWSLVVQTWLSTGLTAFLAWCVCSWRPGRVSSWRSIAAEIQFGAQLTGFNIVNYFHRQFDNVVVGARWGANELGLYSRAYNIFLLPLTAVVWPMGAAITAALSRMQDEPAKWRQTYLVSITTAVTALGPLAIVLHLYATELLVLLFGQQWERSGAILSVLALTIPLQPIYTSGGWIEVSLGRPHRQLIASLFAACVYAAAFLLAVDGGAVSVAWAYTGSVLLIVGPWMWWATRRTPVSLADLVKSCWPPVAVTFGLIGLFELLTWQNILTPSERPVLTLVAACSAYCGTLCLYWFQRSLWRSSLERVLAWAIHAVSPREA